MRRTPIGTEIGIGSPTRLHTDRAAHRGGHHRYHRRDRHPQLRPRARVGQRSGHVGDTRTVISAEAALHRPPPASTAAPVSRDAEHVHHRLPVRRADVPRPVAHVRSHDEERLRAQFHGRAGGRQRQRDRGGRQHLLLSGPSRLGQRRGARRSPATSAASCTCRTRRRRTAVSPRVSRTPRSARTCVDSRGGAAAVCRPSPSFLRRR